MSKQLVLNLNNVSDYFTSTGRKSKKIAHNTYAHMSEFIGVPAIDVYYHNNHIAVYVPETGHLYITFAGWGTPTTRLRLNGLILGSKPYSSARVLQRQGSQYCLGSDIPLELHEWYLIEGDKLKVIKHY